MKRSILALAIMAPSILRGNSSQLNAVYDKQEDIPPQYVDLFSERNGKYELTGVSGVKTQADVDRINNSLVKERNDHKLLRERYAPLNDYDVNDVLTRVSEYDELKLRAESGNFDSTKIDELVEVRIKSRLAPVQRELEQAKTQLGEKEQIITTFQTEKREGTIRGHITKAAVAAKVTDVEDVVALSERLFELDDAGHVVTKDNVGVIPGLAPDVYLKDMMDKKPHWFGPTLGGGAGGSKGNVNGGNNPYSHEHWNMTEQNKIYKANPEKARQLASIHGVDPLSPVQPAKSTK